MCGRAVRFFITLYNEPKYLLSHLVLSSLLVDVAKREGICHGTRATQPGYADHFQVRPVSAKIPTPHSLFPAFPLHPRLVRQDFPVQMDRSFARADSLPRTVDRNGLEEESFRQGTVEGYCLH